MGRKDSRYLCYTFIRESASIVDFEIKADSLAVRIGYAASLMKDLPRVHEDLLYLVDMVYHLNGSVRGKVAIREEDLVLLNELYDFYMEQVKSIRDKAGLFVLPQGSNAACALHICRNEGQQMVRTLHKVSSEKEVPERLFDYANLLTNLLFTMALYVNKEQGIKEVSFVSKSYKIKSMGEDKK